MFVVWEGDQGSGKTLLMTRYIIRQLDKRPGARAYTSYVIDHERAERQPWSFLLSPEAPPGIYGWDEGAAAWDSRMSSSATTSMLNAQRQERKGSREILITVQDLGMLDVRVRRAAQLVHRVTGIWKVPAKHDPVTDDVLDRTGYPRLIRVETWKGKVAEKHRREDLLAVKYVPFGRLLPYASRYDTSEVVGIADHLAARRDVYTKGAGS
jgi:hypothetical protein